MIISANHTFEGFPNGTVFAFLAIGLLITVQRSYTRRVEHVGDDPAKTATLRAPAEVKCFLYF